MIKNLNGKITKNIVSKGEYRGFSQELNERALKLMQALDSVNSFPDLKKICEPPSLKIHKLKGNMGEFWSITIKKPWCIIFKYEQGQFIDVEIGDYHD